MHIREESNAVNKRGKLEEAKEEAEGRKRGGRAEIWRIIDAIVPRTRRETAGAR